MSGPAPIPIAYVTTRFPVRSETAVIKEIHELEKTGFHVTIFSLKRSSFADIHDPKADPLRERTLDVGAGMVLRALVAHLRFGFRRPGAWGGTLLQTLGGAGRHLPKLLWLFLIAPGVAAEVVRRDVRYVHANFGSYQAYVAWVVHRLTGIPYGFTVHAQDIFVNRFMMREKADEASILASISEYNIRFLAEKEGISGSQLVLVRCGVDLAEFPFQEPPTPAEALRVFTVGRFSEKKGLLHLIRACARLRPGIEYRVDLVGKGEEEPRLRREIAELGLGSRVVLKSGVSQSDLLGAYRSSHAMVLPCQEARNGDLDGIPATLMEAMALGVPVITTAVSGIPELVEHDRTGLVVSPEDPDAIARALERLVDEPALGPRLARAARRRVEQDYDIRRNARQMGALIRRAVGVGSDASEDVS